MVGAGKLLIRSKTLSTAKLQLKREDSIAFKIHLQRKQNSNERKFKGFLVAVLAQWIIQ